MSCRPLHLCCRAPAHMPERHGRRHRPLQLRRRQRHALRGVQEQRQRGAPCSRGHEPQSQFMFLAGAPTLPQGQRLSCYSRPAARSFCCACLGGVGALTSTAACKTRSVLPCDARSLPVALSCHQMMDERMRSDVAFVHAGGPADLAAAAAGNGRRHGGGWVAAAAHPQ